MIPRECRLWLGLAGVVLVGGAVIVVLWMRGQEAEGVTRAEMRDSVAAAAEQVRDSLGPLVAAAWDSARTADSVARASRRQEEALRRRLDRVLADLEEQAAADSTAMAQAGSREDSLHAVLLEEVRPGLRPTVVSLMQADSAEDTNAARLRSDLRDRPALLSEQKESLERELEDERAAKVQWRTAARRDSAQLVADSVVIENLRAARDEYRAIVNRPVLAKVFGTGVLEVASEVASAGLAWVAGREKGLAGWGSAKAADVLVAGL